MPCNHKFSNDLLIDYANWEVRTLFIGTFNPSWECCNNNANWFYGRTAKNQFWCILPKIHENNSLINGNRNIWMNFCKRNHIGITDIITSIDDVDVNNRNHRDSICNFKDDELSQFTNTKTNIAQILTKHPTITQICITRKDLSVFWRQCFADMNDWLAINVNRNISVKYLRSPSRGARKGIKGNFCESIAEKWLAQGYQVL